MDILEFEGKTYTRRNGKWVDSKGFIVCLSLQQDLNKKHAKTVDPSKLSLEDCVSEGDKFKNSSSIGLALRFYEEALGRADAVTMAYILPRMTSCYRKSGQPQKAIDVLTYASRTFGQQMVTPVLLTSVAAAYCDLGDYTRAKKCCDRASASPKGKASEELSLVYKKIKMESASE